jgi:hypothetical protein
VRGAALCRQHGCGRVPGASRADESATAGKAGRVKLLEAWRKAVLGPASQSPRATPPLPPIGLDGMARPATLQALAQLRVAPWPPPQHERGVGPPLGRERPRSRGHPHAVEEPAGPRVARGALFWRLRHEARVEPPDQASRVAQTGHEPERIPGLPMDRGHVSSSPESARVSGRSLQQRITDVFLGFPCSMSDRRDGSPLFR